MSKSLRKSINEFCKWCIYDPLAGGNWRQQVTNCPSNGENGPKCPLWDVRPLSKPKKRPEGVPNEVEIDESHG